MKKIIIALAVVAGTLSASLLPASAGNYYRFGPSGYTNTYTDFSVGTPGGTSYSGTIWGR